MGTGALLPDGFWELNSCGQANLKAMNAEPSCLPTLLGFSAMLCSWQ